jgi:hypothetical protein
MGKTHKKNMLRTERRYTERRNGECRCDECHGAIPTTRAVSQSKVR